MKIIFDQNMYKTVEQLAIFVGKIKLFLQIQLQYLFHLISCSLDPTTNSKTTYYIIQIFRTFSINQNRFYKYVHIVFVFFSHNQIDEKNRNIPDSQLRNCFYQSYVILKARYILHIFSLVFFLNRKETMDDNMEKCASSDFQCVFLNKV